MGSALFPSHGSEREVQRSRCHRNGKASAHGEYEENYLNAYPNGREAMDKIDSYFHFYNTQRPHQALDYLTSADVFYKEASPADEIPTERRMLPSGALVNPGTTAILSLKIAPVLSN